MALPERAYYPLLKAIQQINKSCDSNIDTEDLFHYASIGKLEICFRFNATPDYLRKSNEPIQNEAHVEFHPRDENEYSQLVDFIDKYYKTFGKETLHTSDGYLDLGGLDNFDEDHSVVINSLPMDYADLLLALPNIPNSFKITPTNNGLAFRCAYIPRTTIIELRGDTPAQLNIPAIIHFKKPLKILLSDLFITNEELKMLLNGGEEKVNQPEKITSKIKEAKSGRPSNTFQEVILAIAKATREVYPTCTGKSLARKIHQFLANEDNAPSFGTIEQSISKGLISPEEKDTKLNYDLIIPDEFQYIKNK